MTFANTAFGQALSITPLQLGAALASVVNGGQYIQPHLVEAQVKNSGQVKANKPQVKNRAVSAKTSRQVRELMEYVVKHHTFSPALPGGYRIGGKTGTPQIANPAGGYYSDRTNGTYIGYVGGRRPAYVVIVRVNEPHVGYYAGVTTAQPIFGTVANLLINNFEIAPAN